MPPKGYASLTVRREVYEKLEKLRASLGYSSMSNLLIFLVDFYSTYAETKKEVSKCMEILSKCVEKSLAEPPRGG